LGGGGQAGIRVIPSAPGGNGFAEPPGPQDGDRTVPSATTSIIFLESFESEQKS